MSDRDCENCKHHTEKGCDSWDCNFERRMARKEIIEMLKVLKEQALKSHNDTAIIDVKKDSFIYVMDATINSLKMEQIEPCDDAISKQAVLDAIEDDSRNGHYSCFASNNDAQCFKDVIRFLPSVNPQEPKTGRWIESDTVLIVGYTDTDNYINLPAQECSICHKPHIRGYGAYYCPNCGAKMAESEDKE